MSSCYYSADDLFFYGYSERTRNEATKNGPLDFSTEFRLLSAGEQTQPGDEFYDLASASWLCSTIRLVHPDDITRRRLVGPAEKAASETNRTCTQCRRDCDVGRPCWWCLTP